MTQHALSDFFADRKRRPGAGIGDNRGLAALETVQARDDLLTLLNDEFTKVLVGQACAVGVGPGRASDLAGLPIDGVRESQWRRGGRAFGYECGCRVQGQEPSPRFHSRGGQAARQRALMPGSSMARLVVATWS